jgi:hypothetical protein
MIEKHIAARRFLKSAQANFDLVRGGLAVAGLESIQDPKACAQVLYAHFFQLLGRHPRHDLQSHLLLPAQTEMRQQSSLCSHRFETPSSCVHWLLAVRRLVGKGLVMFQYLAAVPLS